MFASPPRLIQAHEKLNRFFLTSATIMVVAPMLGGSIETLAFPNAEADAVDISDDALAATRRNIAD